jgi:hypothetical protein
MLLQKPASGGLIALGIGLWFLARAWRRETGDGRPGTGDRGDRFRGRWSVVGGRLLSVAAWGLLALAILSPYVARNMALFGTPFYTTESHDAWVIEYTDWDDIYKVYTTQAGLSAAGIPDRTWILRWGFDRALLKITNQVVAVRNYLLPPWTDQTVALNDPDSGKKALLFGMGAWLALLGALGVLRSHRRLCTLLLAAFAPYTLFLAVYWHANEERYFVVLMPWLALLAAYALWRGYDRVAAIGDGRWTPVGLALTITAFVAIVQPSWPDIARKVREEPGIYAADTDAYAWLRDHAGATDVVMTRLPWQLNWVSERPALMIPNTADRGVFLRLARYYNARYLVRDTFAQPGGDALKTIDGLIGDGTLRLVYQTPAYRTRQGDLTTTVYRFPADYGGVAELQP